MLTRIELLVTLGLFPMGILIIDKILFHYRGSKLPNGSIVLDHPLSEAAHAKPGNRWSLIGITFAIMIAILLWVFVLFANVFDFWHLMPSTLFISLPAWTNWFGVILGLSCDFLAIFARYYNVNFKLAYQELKGNYVLATGGPYKIIRHPIYVAYCGLTIGFFLITEMWLFLIAIMFWGAVRSQAIHEENFMRQTYGEKYNRYFESTGRFFPKFTRKS